MTERQNDAPEEPRDDAKAAAPTEDNPTELDDDIAEERDGNGAADEDERADAGVDEAEADELAEEAAADESEEELDTDEGEEATAPVLVRPAPVRQDRGRLTRPTAQPAPTPSEQAVRIDDRVSQAFVLLTVAVFVIIFANAALLGKGGVFAAPSPSPSEVLESPSAGVSAAPSGSGASGSPGTSGSAGASGSASLATSGSPGTSGSPAASPSVVPSPSS